VSPHDYGEGKSREQESRDSQVMLGLVIVSALISLLVIFSVVVVRWVL